MFEIGTAGSKGFGRFVVDSGGLLIEVSYDGKVSEAIVKRCRQFHNCLASDLRAVFEFDVLD